MTLLRLRSSSRVVAFVLLAASLRGLPHLQRDDGACAVPVVEQHDHSRHAIGGASAGAAHEHCAVCHWTRLLRPAAARRTGVVRPDIVGVRVHAQQSRLCRPPALDQLPARAPPLPAL